MLNVEEILKIQKYNESRNTGTEKPSPANIKECLLNLLETTSSNAVNDDCQGICEEFALVN